MMRRFGTANEAFNQIVDFLEHFTDLDDPRQRAKVLYPSTKCCCYAFSACPPAVRAGSRSPSTREETDVSAPFPAVHGWYAPHTINSVTSSQPLMPNSFSTASSPGEDLR